MYLIFEYLFYLGLVAFVVGLIALVAAIFDNHWQRVKFGALALLLGVALIAGPAICSRYQVIDLGPRIELTEGEKHITLTGWDRDDYSLLRSHPETIVLQITNADVTDQTIDFLTDMANLRELDLNDSKISDAGLAKIAKLTGLETLRLRGTRVTDAGDLVPRLPMISLLSNDDDHCQKEIVVGGKNLMLAARLISDVAATTADGVIVSGVADLFWGEPRKGMPSHLMGNYLTRLTDQAS